MCTEWQMDDRRSGPREAHSPDRKFREDIRSQNLLDDSKLTSKKLPHYTNITRERLIRNLLIY